MTTIANAQDPMVAVKRARQAMQAGAWRGAAHRDGDTGRALSFLKARFPAAHAVLPRVAVAALTKNPPSPGCHWCTVHMLAALSFDGADAYPPRDAATLAWLGNPCSKCQARHARSDAITASVALYHELVAGGVPPRVAAASPTREDAYQHLAELRVFKQTQLPKARRPTGTRQASGRRRADPPNYYRNPIPWPADAQVAR